LTRTRTGDFEAALETYERLRSPGALLVAGAGKSNIMTIGWGVLGVIWGRPVLTVLVRPSRHTHGFMESHDEFTVCIPTKEMKEAVAFCGTKSGRDVDKAAECGFTMKPGIETAVPYIHECPVHYECRIVQRNQVEASTLDAEIVGQYYPSGDFHTVYFGEILGVYRET
jgi:flavin reductase (DIM6/NTAB) family NADH-FMN oxidoreductase RutF